MIMKMLMIMILIKNNAKNDNVNNDGGDDDDANDDDYDEITYGTALDIHICIKTKMLFLCT